jgi:hypothetical protein
MSRDASPRPVSAALSILAATVAVGFVASAPGQQQALAVEFVGLLALVGGVRLARRGHGLLGGVVALLGLAAVGVAFPLSRSNMLTRQLELFPGLVGLVVLTLGLAPVRRGWERHLVTAGTAIVLVSVATGGVLYEADSLSLLGGIVATVVAWDLGEQSVNVSEQLGDRARTWPVEVTHGVASILVGAGAVALAVGITRVNVTGVPFAGLPVLLGAAVVLTAALYN